jgi:hypothetical protein
LANTPERRGTELIRAGQALIDAVRQRGSHVVQSKVGERCKRPVVEANNIGGSRGKRLRVTKKAAHSAVGGCSK